MIPMVNTADQARRVVQASKFPPVGKRGQGSPFSAWALGLSTPEYLQQANNSLLTIVQIESTEGMDNVDEICGVPGVGEHGSKGIS
jgi:4-hydroxy-2-oxoheptanedioate aldolase